MEAPQFVVISQKELDELRFREEQIRLINKVADKMENAEILGAKAFYDEVMEILRN